MTLHTKEAMDEIYDIFNEPLKNPDEDIAEVQSGDESSEDDDDAYTSAGESTGTGGISGANSEFGDETTMTRRQTILIQRVSSLRGLTSLRANTYPRITDKTTRRTRSNNQMANLILTMRHNNRASRLTSMILILLHLRHQERRYHCQRVMYPFRQKITIPQ
jgi:hypothetical protein